MPHETIVPLVEYRDGGYRVNEETLLWIAERDAPFAVVSCAGKFRTGKSFLLNRFLGTAPGEGFGVGDTVQACTRGIWVCKRFVAGGEGEGGVELLMCDTEGIDALDADNEHDVKVFALSVLMSSVFLYNSHSHLDESAVQTLSLMTKIAECVGGGGHGPHLYWVLRDFSLQLADGQGKAMTHSEYLEQSLSPALTHKCTTREAIKSVFATRHLVTLPRPQKSETAHKLDLKGPGAVSTKFERALNTFRCHVQHNAPPMSANGVPMTGPVFAHYLRTLVEKLNRDGTVPKIEDAFTMLRRTQAVDVERQYRRHVMQEIETRCPRGDQGAVTEWIRGVPFPFPPFVSPEEVRRAAFDDVYATCVSMGRLLQPHELLQDEVDHLLSGGGLEAGGTDDMTPTMRVLRGAVLKAVDLGVARADDRARDDRDIQVLTLEATISSLRQEIADILSTAATQSEAPRPTCVDAAVSTDPPEDEVADGQEEGGGASVGFEGSESYRLMKTQLVETEEQNRMLSEEATFAGEREERMKHVFHESMEALRATSCAAIDEMKKENDQYKNEAAKETQRREALTDQCEKNREVVRASQENALDVHKNMLEEFRRRDMEMRVCQDERRKEKEAMSLRVHMSENENRGMKRLVVELQENEVDVKRMRRSLRDAEMGGARDKSELAQGKERLLSYREEVSDLRRVNIQMETRIAVLEATSKLESCRRSMA